MFITSFTMFIHKTLLRGFRAGMLFFFFFCFFLVGRGGWWGRGGGIGERGKEAGTKQQGGMLLGAKRLRTRLTWRRNN